MSDAKPSLFDPIQIGPKTAKNRVWMLAHGTQLVKDHNFTDRHVAYYAERAKGGVGVITMEAMATHPTTQPYEGKIFAFDRAVIPNYQKLSKAVHEHGALLLGELTDGFAQQPPLLLLLDRRTRHRGIRIGELLRPGDS